MYKDYFNLTDFPFHNTPNPRFFFESQNHKETLANMAYCVLEGKGFVVITGEVGSGKTLLIQALKSELGDHHVVIEIANPKISQSELLAAVVSKLGLENPGESALWDVLKERLIALAEENRRVVILIDEAHQLPESTFTSLCLLSNIETLTQKLLQIVLVGQDELTALLEQHSLRQINQRISHRACLHRLSSKDTQRYIHHRLRVAGGHPRLFPPESVELIFQESQGIPRIINNLCDKSLLFACGRKIRRVTLDIVRKAIDAQWPERRFASLPDNVKIIDSESTEESSKPDSGLSDKKAAIPLPFAAENPPENQNKESELPMKTFLSGEAPTNRVKENWAATKSGKLLLVILMLFGAFAFWQVFGQRQKTQPPVLSQQEQIRPQSEIKDGPELSTVPKQGAAQTQPSSAPVVPNPPESTMDPIPLPGSGLSSMKTRDEITSSRNSVNVLATRYYGAWNESARDLLSSVNPDLANVEDPPSGTLVRFPIITRESLIVKDDQGRYFVYFGSFEDADFARTNLESIRRSFNKAEIYAATRGEMKIHRLFVGPYANSSEAAAVANSLWYKYLPVLN